MSSTARYIIVTPAYNESGYIGATIRSVRKQSVKPVCWMIVDDGSTDDTPDVIARESEGCDWIRYFRRDRSDQTSYFGNNVFAIMAGYERMTGEVYDFVAILDADISPPTDYYRTILDRFAQDAKLGIASGVYENVTPKRPEPVLHDRRSTPKALQVFRREVFEGIGGFLPLRHGGEDTCACIMARMRGWKTWSFPDLVALHHRPTGTGNAGTVLRARFVQGLNEYGMGSHWLFVALKCLRRVVKERPYVIGGLCRWLGFLAGYLKREERQIPRDVVRFNRREQRARVFQGNRIPEEYRIKTPDNLEENASAS